MSKIFEALRRAQEEGSELPPLLLADEGNEVVGAPAYLAPQEGASAAAGIDESQKAERIACTQDSLRTLAIRVPAGAPVLPFDGVSPRSGEQYRILRTKILHHPSQPHLCVVTSPGPGDGKTVTSINLAGALALRTDARVVLVDGDLRRSTIASLLGLPETPGLADVLSGSCALEDALIRVEQLPSLYVIPAGQPQSNPTELLDSSRWRETCAALREQFRFAIFDVPPVASVADYELIQASSDGVVLVVRPDHTKRSLCFKALSMIPKEKMIGFAVNCVFEWFLWRTQGYYYYSAGHKGGTRGTQD